MRLQLAGVLCLRHLNFDFEVYLRCEKPLKKPCAKRLSISPHRGLRAIY